MIFRRLTYWSMAPAGPTSLGSLIRYLAYNSKVEW